MKDWLLKYTSPSKIFLFSLLGFILGIFLGPVFSPFLPFDYRIFGVLFFLIGGGTVFFWENKILRTLGLFSLFLIFGFFRYQLALLQKGPNFIHFYNGFELEIEGRVVSFPDERVGKVSFEVGDLKIKNLERRVLGKIYVEGHLYPEIAYGDHVLLKGKLKAPENTEDFAQKDYLASRYIFSILNFPEIKILEKEKGNLFWQTIFRLREKIKRVFWTVLPSKEASLLSAIVLGVKKEMPSSLYDLFAKTGTAHLIVVSGFHLVILAEILLRSLRPYLGSKTLFLVIFVAFAFVLLTGANPPALRAFIFILLLYLGEFLGRKSYFPITIFLAAFLLLLVNPFLLRFSLSFQLSFLATAGIVLLSPFFEIFFRNIPELFRFPLSATISAQLFMFPFLIFGFSSFPFISLLANSLVILPAEFLLIGGFLMGVLGVFSHYLAFLFVPLVYPLANFIFGVLDFLAKVPSLSWKIVKFPVIFASFYYLFLLFFVLKIQKNYGKRKAII